MALSYEDLLLLNTDRNFVNISEIYVFHVLANFSWDWSTSSAIKIYLCVPDLTELNGQHVVRIRLLFVNFGNDTSRVAFWLICASEML